MLGERAFMGVPEIAERLIDQIPVGLPDWFGGALKSEAISACVGG